MEKKFIVPIEKDSDGTYVAYNQTGDGYVLIWRGNTVTVAREDFANSMKEVAESETERGKTVPEILLNEPEYRFDLFRLAGGLLPPVFLICPSGNLFREVTKMTIRTDG